MSTAVHNANPNNSTGARSGRAVSADNPDVVNQSSVSNRKLYKSGYKSAWSYDDRYAYAIENGMSPEDAKEWASYTYATVEDSEIMKLAHKLGFKLSSTKKYEENEAADAEAWNNIMNRAHNEEYKDPVNEVARREAAGINDSLTAGKEIGSGETTDIDDAAMSQQVASTQAINEAAASRPLEIASALMTAAGGVMNMINAGVDISKTFLDMDISEGTAAFDLINGISDLGNFFPFLGIGYDPEEDTWREYENDSFTDVLLDTKSVYGMSRSEFMDRIRKNTGIRSRAYMNELYNAYKGMASPKAINAYMEARRSNMATQNDTIDEAAKGVARTGALTLPSFGYGTPGFAVDNPKFSSKDREVFNYYIQTAADLELMGLQAGIESKRKSFNADYITNQSQATIIELVNRLRQDAHKSMFANYLLVNMMSGTFKDIGTAAYFNFNPQIKSFKDLWDFGRDASSIGFMKLGESIANGAIPLPKVTRYKSIGGKF